MFIWKKSLWKILVIIIKSENTVYKKENNDREIKKDKIFERRNKINRKKKILKVNQSNTVYKGFLSPDGYFGGSGEKLSEILKIHKKA